MSAASATTPRKDGLPYRVDAEYDIMNILKHRHEIPYHSRPFMWSRDAHIDYVLKEMIRTWREHEPYWLGIVILFTGDEHPSISDAQHRITLCFLMVLALSQMLGYPAALGWISKYGDADDILTPDIPEADRLLLDKFGWVRLPNIVSSYEEDLEALGNLLNSVESEAASSESNLYAAFISVKEILTESLPESSQQREFLRYLYNDVKVLRIAIPEWRFTLRVFNSFNNIKVPVPPSYLLKNAFIAAMGVSRSEEIHTVFCELKRADYERFIHTVTDMYLREIRDFKDYERTVGGLIEPTTDGSCPLARFRAVSARVDDVTSYLCMDLCGRFLLNNLSRGYEVMNLCLRPIGFVALETGDVASFQKVIRMLCAYAIRLQAPVNFNKYIYRRFLTPHMNSLLAGTISLRDMVTALRTQLGVWLGPTGASNPDVAAGISTTLYAKKPDFQYARAMLLYLVLKTDSHEMTLDPDATQIDHIFPRKPRAVDAPLTNKDNCHRLGNFTPLVGKNSTGGMKGNCALGNKPFAEKVQHYGASNLKMTRDVATLYGATEFRDAEIDARSSLLAEKIATVTAAELGL